MAKKYTNQLINENSPYLLQHAHNPVNWYPWGDEALKKARKEDKPILVSIGYSACHWCHVMERESFEDTKTAQLMNEGFINIKIDREERPDLDHIYMDALQAMTGSGGWPLNVFLTPDAKPFYGGTYFPPQRAYNRPSWQETLLSVLQAFREKRNEIESQAENLTEHIFQSNAFGNQKMGEEQILNDEKVHEVFQQIMKSADRVWGGFGKAPKFPQTFSIQFLLRYHLLTNNKEALEQALLSLDKMIEGGIYDQVGGGFARYSTDTEWLAPHFEKMLYDNALLVSVLCEAYQLTKKATYKEVIHETIQFIQRELYHPQKGFYAALDADSEGKEGKFYVWTKDEVKRLMEGEEANLFCEYYDISSTGNWEEVNILRVMKSQDKLAKEKNIPAEELKEIIAKGKKSLLEERNKRTRPGLDDKIILGWNALMNTACSKAFAATGMDIYKEMAIANMNFLLTAFALETGDGYYHTWKNQVAKYPAFLDDYAFLIESLFHLQEITSDKKWLLKARSITERVIEHFSEPETGFFFFTPITQTDIIVRKKEVYDGAVPSGNSVMAYNLHRLSIYFDNNEWRDRSFGMIRSLGQAISRYPSSFGNWACLLQEMIAGTNEIVLLGKDYMHVNNDLISYYIPHKILIATDTLDPAFPILNGKPASRSPLIYLCRNYTCQSPVFSAKELISLINRPPNP